MSSYKSLSHSDKAQPASIKGNTVYMILYNYDDCDYSIIKIMENLEDAYKYICYQESNYIDKSESFNMIEVTKFEHIEQQVIEDKLNICYISSGKYNKISLCLNMENVSNYAIVPMLIN